MSSIDPQQGSAVGITTETRPAEPQVMSHDRTAAYPPDNVTARIQSRGASDHNTDSGRSHDQNVASLAADMAIYREPTQQSSVAYGGRHDAASSLLLGVGSRFD